MICNYCERTCDIAEGISGYCRMYRSEAGAIIENYPDAFLNIYPVSSESIPMLHFYPNSIFLLVSTIGCNFACDGCISEFQTTRPGTLEKVLTPHTPDEILAIARESSCRGITFCLNEPTVSLPTFIRLATAAKNEGFLVGCSSNGYMTEDTIRQIIPFLDFINIGLKGSSDERYRECGVVSGDPVFRNLKILHDAGVFIEVSIMYLFGREDEIYGAVDRIRNISQTIPIQVMRFIATHEELNAFQPTKEQAEAMCKTLQKTLDHVYLFNTPATSELDSRCPVCGETIVHRVFFGPMAARVLSCRSDGVCNCGYRYPHQGDIVPVPIEDTQVLGGYRSIMGAKFIASFLNVLGITDESEIDQLCNTVIINGYLRYLQDQQDSLETFTSMTRYLADLSGRHEVGERLIGYAMQVATEIAEQVQNAEKPRVCGVFCHPLSPMYATKFGNTLVEMTGGLSLNKQENFRESSHAEYTVEEFNRLNPDMILISGHFAPSIDDFLTTCRDLGISCRAISEKKVYVMDSEYSSGNLGWLISLMDVANIMHPELFSYSLEKEKARLETFIATVSA
ncbi:MAG: radical SAM protein [Methanospirillum sp.]|uniref:radical SAM protein n=1 Tax=Methanospirillum sp. TaxID=45200 RepID=UPI002369C0BD|nr:radical SAM protein [Methanospirillum sp.]MDD1727452.1 radical SAM protein [Methanospirillum sp.]